jgi:hypothetical protein
LDTPLTLRRIRDSINADYLSAQGSEIFYLRRLSVRGPAWSSVPLTQPQIVADHGQLIAVLGGPASVSNELDEPFPEPSILVPAREMPPLHELGKPTEFDPRLTEFYHSQAPHGGIELSGAWNALIRQLGMTLPVRFHPLHRPDLPASEYLISREGDEVPVRRFRHRLRILGKYLLGCPEATRIGSLPPPNVLDFCLHFASTNPSGALLEAHCYFWSAHQGGPLVPVNCPWNLETLRTYQRGELDWSPGDYFFVLVGDARDAVVECTDQYLGLGMVPQAPAAALASAVGIGTADSESCGFDRTPLDESRVNVPARPHWDRQGRKLMYGEVCCREFRKEAPHQFALLDAFEAQGWPELMSGPFRRDRLLRQTVKDLNGGLLDDSPVRFRVINLRVNWYSADQEAASQTPSPPSFEDISPIISPKSHLSPPRSPPRSGYSSSRRKRTPCVGRNSR